MRDSEEVRARTVKSWPSTGRNDVDPAEIYDEPAPF
jgi:hypothetical protein